MPCRLLTRPIVYEVVFMVVPDQQQTLGGLVLQLCNESDELDDDFQGHVEVSSPPF